MKKSYNPITNELKNFEEDPQVVCISESPKVYELIRNRSISNTYIL